MDKISNRPNGYCEARWRFMICVSATGTSSSADWIGWPPMSAKAAHLGNWHFADLAGCLSRSAMRPLSRAFLHDDPFDLAPGSLSIRPSRTISSRTARRNFRLACAAQALRYSFLKILKSFEAVNRVNKDRSSSKRQRVSRSASEIRRKALPSVTMGNSI